MPLATHIRRRGAVYYYRIRVPVHLMAVVGRRELTRSLHTADAAVARRRQASLALLTERLWAALRPDMTPDEISSHIERWLMAKLDDDAAARDAHDADGRFATVMADLGDARERHAANDQTVSQRHVDELFSHAGVALGDREREIANRLMLRAHVRLLRAVTLRTQHGWLPYLKTDPGVAFLDRPLSEFGPEPPASMPTPTTQSSPMSSGTPPGTALSLKEAANQAIPEIARMEGLTPGRVDDYEVAVRMFIEWYGADPDLAAITPELAGRYKLDLTHYPTNAGKRLPYRNLDSVHDKLKAAKAAGERKTLNATTINTKYLTPLRRVIEWQRANGRRLDNPFVGVSVRARKQADPHAERRPFSDSEVRALFALPLFTGAAGTAHHKLYRAGPYRVSDWRYWVPLICLFSGLRLNEACGLTLADFNEEDGVAYIHVRDDAPGQRLKSAAARRRVPLHSELIALGLVQHVEQLRNRKRERLFEELKLGRRGVWSNKASKFFIDLVARVAEDDPGQPGKLTFHSTRHTVITRLRAAEVRMDVSKAIVGHEQGEVHGEYGGFDLKTLKVAIEKIDYDGLDLSSCRLQH
jgi:integrase